MPTLCSGIGGDFAMHTLFVKVDSSSMVDIGALTSPYALRFSHPTVWTRHFKSLRTSILTSKLRLSLTHRAPPS